MQILFVPSVATYLLATYLLLSSKLAMTIIMLSFSNIIVKQKNVFVKD